MSGGLTFRGWLALQRDRTDVLGDLARASLDGGYCSRACPFTTYTAFLRHLVLDHDPPGPHLAACRRAGREYRAYSRIRQVEP